MTADSESPPPPPSETTPDERNMAMFAHLGGAIFAFVPSLIIWLMKKDQGGFAAEQAKEALNFQITVTIAYLIAGASTMVMIGFALTPAVFIINVVFCILAGVAASKGTAYRYPLTLRLIN